MKFLNKAEDSINKLLIVVGETIKKFVTPHLPQRTIKKARVQKKIINKRKKVGVKKIKKNAAQLKNISVEYKSKVQLKVKKAKAYDYKSLRLKHIFLFLSALFLPFLKKIKVWYSTIRPQTVALVISGTTITTLLSLNIYVESQKMSREPASASEAELQDRVENAKLVSQRANYHRKLEKQFRIDGVILPIYLGQNRHVHKLSMDLTVDTSNKYIKAYLNENHHYVLDVLNTKVSQVDVDFPLQEEGKIVIRDKIKKELKLLLKRLEIKGDILEVHISSVFGG